MTEHEHHAPGHERAAEVLGEVRREMRLARVLASPPRVTHTLLALLIVFHTLVHLWAWRLSSGAPDPVPFGAALAFGWKSGPAIEAGQWWRLVTPAFLHGNLLHLLVNGYALHVLGPLVERLQGSHRYLVLLLLTAIAGTTASLAFTPAPAVGASGAIFGLLGAAMALGLRSRDALPPRMRRALVLGLLPWVLLNFAIGFVVPRVDNAAHLGGFLAGGALALVMGHRMRPAPHGHRAWRAAAIVAALVTALAVGHMLMEVRRCGGSVPAFEACYRADFEAAREPEPP